MLKPSLIFLLVLLTLDGLVLGNEVDEAIGLLEMLADHPDNEAITERLKIVLPKSEKILEAEKHQADDIDPNLTACQIIAKHGYQCQTHHVTTEDGYIIQAQRIPGKKKNFPPIYLQHGMLASSVDFMLNKKHECLPFLLADEGYDVWLGNVRGNTYGRSHTKLNPKQKQFWDFSWDEHGKYDMAAITNHALSVTGHKQLYYVGFSQGSLMGFTQIEQNERIKGKIKKFFALGPAYQISHVSSGMKLVAKFSKTIHATFKLFGQYELLPSNTIIKLLAKGCGLISASRYLCNNIVFLIAGADSRNKDPARIPSYLQHIPAGSSVKNLIHFAQIVKSGRCQRFDYGSAKANAQKYKGSSAPPIYDIKQMTAPTIMFWGGRDKLTTPEDVRLWKDKVPNLIADHFIPDYDHLDFLWATNAHEKIYKTIIEYLSKEPTA